MFVKVTNGVASSFSFNQFRRQHPEKSYPSNYFEIATDAELAADDIYRAVDVARPANPNEFLYDVVRRSPELVDGQWVIDWDITEKTEADKLRYSESAGNWDAFNFGLASVAGFIEWKAIIEKSPTTDGHYFEILRGALTTRNLGGMQAAYSAISKEGKPPEATRIGLQNLAKSCKVYVNFLIEGDRP